MIELFGKDEIKKRLDSLHKSNRLPHAILLWGDSGVGKKTLARYISKLFLENDNSATKNADRIFTDTHPDVVFVKNLQEDGGKYTAELIRNTTNSSVIKPNDGDTKVYIFNDADEMSVLHQNLLLKLIEEPPSFVKFVFTARDLSKIITTIISRVTAFNIMPAEISDCKTALKSLTDLSENECGELAVTFSGNIGQALNSIENSAEQVISNKAKNAVNAIIIGSEYEFLATISSLTKREEIWLMLDFFIEFVRKAMHLSVGSFDNGPEVSVKLSKKMSKKRIASLLELLLDLQKYREANLSIPLLTSHITSEIFLNLTSN